MSEDIYFRQPRADMLPLLPQRYTKVLEIGCGEGLFSAGLDKTAERWGIEPDAEAAARAQSRLDRVLVCDYFAAKAQLPTGHFDLIICNDVIEHMPDHDAFLHDIQTYLAPAGVLIASIPNIRYFPVLWELLVFRDFRYRDSGVLDRTHLRFFTARSLKRSLQDAGFCIEQFRMLNPLKMRLTFKRILLLAVTLVTFGAYRDLWFRQFGVRVRSGSPCA
ncbi:MAG: class I SAM-dependent methyltransferase [Pseudomonadota bacterium]|nr:class I SAM-dependent methyltransferase [Pseudomonadota bacterium]